MEGRGTRRIDMVQAVEGEWWEGGVKEGGRGKVVQT